MRAMCLLVAVLLPLVCSAQSTANNDIAVKAVGGFIALSVADIKASTQWYMDKFGLKVMEQHPRTAEQKAAVAILEGPGLIVELIEYADAVPLAKAAPGIKGNIYVHGIFKTGIIVEDYEKTVATLKSRGVEIAYGPFTAKDNQRANVIIKDNAGNLIQLFSK